MGSERQRGRPVIGFVSGFFFGLFLGLDLLFAGVIRLESPVLTVLPVLGALAGFGLGWWAPFGRVDDPSRLDGLDVPEVVVVDPEDTDADATR